VKQNTANILLAITLLLCSTPALAETIASYAFINDDGTLRINRKTIHLYGIVIPQTSVNCARQQPSFCGERAALALEFKIKGFVRCEVMDEKPDGSIIGRCFANYSNFDEGDDLSAYLLERGWAAALPDAPAEYQVLERIAQYRRMGIWGIAIDRPYIDPFK
jgi:endonuclease YncB( thermonuclease family)